MKFKQISRPIIHNFQGSIQGYFKRIQQKGIIFQKILDKHKSMQVSQLHYYCYDCENHFASFSSAFSCLRCDSNAIENCLSEQSTESLSQFKAYQLEQTNSGSKQPLGILDNTVNPRRQQNRSVFSFSRTTIQHRVSIIDVDSIGQVSRLSGRISRILSALLGDQVEERVSQEELSKLEKINNVSQCSICQESQEEDTGSNQYRDGGYKLRCGHAFHEGCIKPWFEKARTCPLCRKSISQEE